jgi:threonine dehydrogenase-like Zn-dependent dehydrogenase
MTTSDAAPTARAPSATRAAVVVAPGRAALQEVAVPRPGAGEVRLRLEGSGVCGSSLPIWEGRPWFDYPLEPGAPGHEGWGYVDAVGSEDDAAWLGQRVAALSYRAHAQHDLAASEALVRLPPSLDGVPFPGEGLGCAMNVIERSDIVAGETVAVIGIGFLGALLVQLASRAGARVIALSRRPFALEVARRCGADETLTVDDHEVAEARVAALTGGSGCERVIEAVGAQAPLTLAGRLAGVRGRLVIAGFHQDGPREIDLQRWNWQGLDVVNAHERDPARYVAGMRAAVVAVETGRLDPQPLYTHVVGLERLGEAYEAMRSRPDGFLKALVTT